MHINKYISWTTDGENTIIINSQTKKCLVLDPTGNEIWELLCEHNSIEKVVEMCLQKYCQDDPKLIKKDIYDFVELLKEYNVITQ